MPGYNPKDADGTLLEPGTYDAVVKRAIEKESASGNDMIELILTVYGSDGTRSDVFDYLVFAKSVLYKVKHFCESAGLNFESGNLDASDCEEANVRVKLKIEESDKYPPKNSVADYVPRDKKAGRVPATAGATSKQRDPDVPF